MELDKTMQDSVARLKLCKSLEHSVNRFEALQSVEKLDEALHSSEKRLRIPQPAYFFYGLSRLPKWSLNSKK